MTELIRLGLRVNRADLEVVLAELIDIAPAGFEERDIDEQTVELAFYGAPGELPTVPNLKAAVGSAFVDLTSTEVPDDWEERWKQFHKPVEVVVGDRCLRVRPPWEAAGARSGEIDLVIDPGQAFGTGGHWTTRMTLELLLSLEPGGAFADWGCGSGVLAIAAAKLGYDPVRACDWEVASVEATKTNASVNGVDIAVERVDLCKQQPPQARTVAANLQRPLLETLADSVKSLPERLIVSGLLRTEADSISSAFAQRGLREMSRLQGGEWAALLLSY